MTVVRALIIGLIGLTLCLFIAAFGFINDNVIRLTFLVGNHLPIAVFGLLAFIAIAINPILFAIKPSLRLRTPELAIICMMALVGCSVASSGLMRTFTTSLAMPWAFNDTNVSWQKAKVLERMPSALLVPSMWQMKDDGKLLVNAKVTADGVKVSTNVKSGKFLVNVVPQDVQLIKGGKLLVDGKLIVDGKLSIGKTPSISGNISDGRLNNGYVLNGLLADGLLVKGTMADVGRGFTVSIASSKPTMHIMAKTLALARSRADAVVIDGKITIKGKPVSTENLLDGKLFVATKEVSIYDFLGLKAVDDKLLMNGKAIKDGNIVDGQLFVGKNPISICSFFDCGIVDGKIVAGGKPITNGTLVEAKFAESKLTMDLSLADARIGVKKEQISTTLRDGRLLTGVTISAGKLTPDDRLVVEGKLAMEGDIVRKKLDDGQLKIEGPVVEETLLDCQLNAGVLTINGTPLKSGKLSEGRLTAATLANNQTISGKLLLNGKLVVSGILVGNKLTDYKLATATLGGTISTAEGKFTATGDLAVHPGIRMNEFDSGRNSQRKGFSWTQIFSTEKVTQKDGTITEQGYIPWSQWGRTLKIWVPLILLTGLAVICLSVIVHRQWVYRERLRYPIADFTSSLLQQDENSALNSIFRNKLFWLGLLAILAIRAVNGTFAWSGGKFIDIPLMFDLSALSEKWPMMRKAGGAWSGLIKPTIFPTVVAFAFFLATDVSFSLGISQMVAAAVLFSLVQTGVDISYNYMDGGITAYQRFGSYLGLALLLLYIGRRYYWAVIRAALTFTKQEDVKSYVAWSCRIMLLSVFGLVFIMSYQLNVAWPLALIMVLVILLIFVVIARINAESGLFFCQPGWQPFAIMVGLFGASSLGIENIMVFGLLCAVLTIDPRECLMPFLVNGLRICDDAKIKPAKVGMIAAATFALSIAVAIPVVLWSNYNAGAPSEDSWGYKAVPSMTPDVAAKYVTQLEQSKELEISDAKGTWQRVSGLWQTHAVKNKFLIGTGVGLALVLVFSFCRLRFPWWPIHPVIFLVWDTYPLMMLSHSFLLGWLIKVSITKFGASDAYRNTRILMIGCIVGDLFGGLIFMAIGWGYVALTGENPNIQFSIFPR